MWSFRSSVLVQQFFYFSLESGNFFFKKNVNCSYHFPSKIKIKRNCQLSLNGTHQLDRSSPTIPHFFSSFFFLPLWRQNGYYFSSQFLFGIGMVLHSSVNFLGHVWFNGMNLGNSSLVWTLWNHNFIKWWNCYSFRIEKESIFHSLIIFFRTQFFLFVPLQHLKIKIKLILLWKIESFFNIFLYCFWK